MNRDSLLPRSLFSASTLKLEPVEETLDSVAQSANTGSTTRQQPSIKDTLNRNLERNSIENEVDQIEESDSSSSSSSSEEDVNLQLTHFGTSSQQIMNALILKLERQQSKQNRYLDKVKNINKEIKKTSRLVGHHANLLVDATIPHMPTPPVKESPQLAKRSAPFESGSRAKRRIAIEDDDDDDDEVEETLPIIEQRTKKVNTPVPHPQFSVVPPRSQFSVVPPHPRRINIEFNFGTNDKMDVYTLRRKQQEIMSSKKPRSLLYNIADNNMDRGMSELMIATSLDGELQFWNSVERRKIKTIGKDHLYDSWIDDICWATPSTLAFCPSQKLLEPVKLVHICNVTKTNVEGRIQTLEEGPHENGVSVIASLDTGTYASSFSETCSFVTGGYDKSVYLWGLKRESPQENFIENGVHRLNIKHTAAVYSLYYDKFKNVLFSGGSDERLVLFDMQSNSTIRELRLQQRVSQINQSKANPNIMLITTTNRTEQFCIYDQRVPGFDGIKLKFGQSEQDTLSRFIKPDMHDNGYMVCCGGQGAPKLNFWDLRYNGVHRGPSFHMDTQAVTRSLRSMFIPHQDTIVSVSSSRYMTWIDYAVKKNEVPKNLIR